MIKSDVVKYKRKISKDVAVVDEAISKGTNLTNEEWFDFICKCSFIGYSSTNTLKHKVFNRKMYKLAETFAEIVSYLISIMVNGFSNKYYLNIIKRIVFRMNKFISGNPISYYGFDKNGVFYVRLYEEDKVLLTFSIKDKKEAIKGIYSVVDYFVTRCFVGEFSTFLNNYISNEVYNITNGVEPKPFVSVVNRQTLASFFNVKFLN